MSLNFKTIPELFLYLGEIFKNNKPIVQRKVDGKFKGIDYEELKTQTSIFANGLAALGIKKGDKIAIISENRPEWVYSDMAITGLGAVDVPLYPSLTADSVEYILNNSEAIAVIVSNKLQLNKLLKIKDSLLHLKHIILFNEKDLISGEPMLYTFKDIQEMGKIFSSHNPGFFFKNLKRVTENDLCTIIYTSGTTGEPKGVLITHKNICSNVKAALECLPVSSEDIFLSYLPLSHIFERMAGYYTAFSTGGTIYFAESIEAVASNLLEVKPTIITTVPRLFERIYSKIIKSVDAQPPAKQKIFYWAVDVGKKMASAKKSGKVNFFLKSQYVLADKLVFNQLREKTGGRLRFFVSGGAALPLEMGLFFEAIGIIILEGYGMTEASPVIAVNRADDYKFGSVGKPVPGVEVKIASDGEILVKGPNVMQGYYKNRKETFDTLKNGWLYTGDVGSFDNDGFLFITDRKKQLFKASTGKYIAPTPIENLFLQSKYIDQIMLIGDKKMFLSALIVPDFESIKEYARSHSIGFTSEADLTSKKNILELIEQEVKTYQKRLANFEKVRRFKLLSKPFTIESGELTPSLKIRRKIVEENYKAVIDEMYSK